jgi:hypothetical protein
MQSVVTVLHTLANMKTYPVKNEDGQIEFNAYIPTSELERARARRAFKKPEHFVPEFPDPGDQEVFLLYSLRVDDDFWGNMPSREPIRPTRKRQTD